MKTSITSMTICLSAAILISEPAQAASVAITDLNQGDFATLNYTAPTNSNSYGVKFDTRVGAQQSDFNNNWALQTTQKVNGVDPITSVSDTTKTFGEIGYDTGGQFLLGLDVQEPGSAVDMNIFGIKLEIGDSEANLATVWELNAGQDYTMDQRIITDVTDPGFYSGTINQIDLFSNGVATNGNNINLLVKIPVGLLIAMSPEIRSNWLVKLTWLEDDYGGGKEEWFLSSPDAAGVTFLQPGETLKVVPVPAPASALLIASGLGLAALMRRRRRAKPDA